MVIKNIIPVPNAPEKEHYIDIPPQCTAQGQDLLVRCMTNDKALANQKSMVLLLPSIASLGGKWFFKIHIVDVGKNSDKCNIIVRPDEKDDVFGYGEIVIKIKGNGIWIFPADSNDWRGGLIM